MLRLPYFIDIYPIVTLSMHDVIPSVMRDQVCICHAPTLSWRRHDAVTGDAGSVTSYITPGDGGLSTRVLARALFLPPPFTFPSSRLSLGSSCARWANFLVRL